MIKGVQRKVRGKVFIDDTWEGLRKQGAETDRGVPGREGKGRRHRLNSVLFVSIVHVRPVKVLVFRPLHFPVFPEVVLHRREYVRGFFQDVPLFVVLNFF